MEVTTPNKFSYYMNNDVYLAKESIPYQKLYRFGQHDIFRILVNTGVPFQVYRYFLYL